MRILSRILCLFAALMCGSLAFAGTSNPVAAPTSAVPGSIVTYGSRPDQAASGNPGIGTSGNNLCQTNANCTYSGTENHTGTFQKNGTTQTFPSDGHILGDADVSTVATSGQYSDLLNKPASLPPSGAAGGDLTGSFPSPTVSKINGATPAAVATSGAYSDLSGKPTALPPNGSASGDLGGSYPSPVVGKVNGVVYGATPSTNTVPVVDSSNHTTYESVPNAALANDSVTVAGQVVLLGGSISIACANLSNAGDACQKNTGTSTGTLAAGDDSRIVGSAQKAQNLADLPSPSTARGNLNAAASGANTDITSLGGITTPISKAQGGSGNTTGQPSGTAGGDISGTYPSPTVAKVNGVGYNASPSTNTVAVVTGSNQTTYEAVPNAALANNSMTIAGHVVALGGSQTIACTDLTGVGTACAANTGISGAALGLLNANKTDSGNNHLSGNNVVDEMQDIPWNRVNPTSTYTVTQCGTYISSESVSVPLEVIGPTAPSNNCTLWLFANLTGADIYFDPCNAGANVLNYVKSDDFDRICSPIRFPVDQGHKAIPLHYMPTGVGWISIEKPLPSSIFRYNLSNNSVQLSHDAANSRVQLQAINGGGLTINQQHTFIPVTGVYLPDANIINPAGTYNVYAIRQQDIPVATDGAVDCGTVGGTSGKECLTFSSTDVANFVSGDPITCVNFFGTPWVSATVPGGNVNEDANTVRLSSTIIQLSDVTFGAVEPHGEFGTLTAPVCAFPALVIDGASAYNPITAVQVRATKAWETLVGTVTVDGSANVLKVTSQFNSGAPALLPSTPIASIPSIPTTTLNLASNDGGGPAVSFNDGNGNNRRVGDGQVLDATPGARGLLARFPVRASTKLQGQIETVYQMLKDNGLIVAPGTCAAHCLTGLWGFSNPNQANSLINWANPGTCDLTVIGTPPFTANQGYTGDGSTGLLSTGCLESALDGVPTDPTGAQDSFAVGAYVLTPSASPATIIGQISGASGRRIYFTSASSGALSVRLHNATAASYTPTRYNGMFTAFRDPNSVGQINAALDENSSNFASTSQSNTIGTLAFLGTNDASGNEYSTAKLCFAYTGQLTATDLAHLRAAMADYFCAQMGAITPTVANLPPAADFKGQSYFVPDLGGGGGLLQSDGTNWARTDSGGYEARTTATGSETLTSLTNACDVEYTANLTGNTTVTLSGADAKGATVKKGACFRLTLNQAVPGSFTFAIKDGPSTNTLITFGSATNKDAFFKFNGTNWRLMQDGAL